MDDMARFQPIALGDLGFAGPAAVQCAAFGEQFGTGGAMDGTIDAATAQQRFIRGIDDRIDIEPRDVAYDNLEGSHGVYQ
jgi:hypothetical protein